MGLGSCVAVALVNAGSCSSEQIPSQGTCIHHSVALKKQEKKKRKKKAKAKLFYSMNEGC